MASVSVNEDPEFPVVDPDPSLRTVINALRTSDWRNAAAATAISFPFGYWAGRPVLMVPTMYMAGTIGATFGVILGLNLSFGRLVGFKENAREVAKFGIHKPEIAPITS